MEHYLGVAREEGVKDDEIGAVQAIVMAVSAGRVESQFRAARAGGRAPAPGVEETKEGGQG